MLADNREPIANLAPVSLGEAPGGRPAAGSLRWGRKYHGASLLPPSDVSSNLITRNWAVSAQKRREDPHPGPRVGETYADSLNDHPRAS